jgi:putative transposase
MIDTGHKKLSVRRQAALLGVNRNRLPKCSGGAGKPPGGDLAILRDLDVLHTRWPFYGQRKLLVELRKRGWRIGRKRLRRLMQLAGIAVVAPKRRTSVPNASHRKYPYLLRGLAINHADQAWCADITYIRMERGFAYLVAVMDWHTRAVLAWRISNTLDTAFCVDALNDAVKVAGCVPEIFNTDQGCQFTSSEWIAAVEGQGIRVSMDGRGRWLDNVFIERLWRSLKCENIYLREYRNLVELEAGVAVWIHDYNHERTHQALGYQMPWRLYRPPAGEPDPEPIPKSRLAKAA